MPSKAKSYRVGLVGCGWIAPYQLAGWRAVSGADVVAVCDANAERANELGSRFDVAWSGDDFEDMLRSGELDILDIATPPDSHVELAFAAMRRGLNVLCQKPVALNLAEAKSMIAFADNAGVSFYVNEMLRYCPWFKQSHELLRAGKIGRPVFARLFNRSPGFLEVGPQRRIRYGFREFLKRTDKVIMLEETIHYFDVARYLFGDPTGLYVATERVSSAIQGEDVATAVLRYEGLTVVIENSWSAHGPLRSGLEIEGTEGAILLSDGRLDHYSASDDSMLRLADYSNDSWEDQRPMVFAGLFADFLTTVSDGAHRTRQATDNLQTLQLTLAAYQSAEEGRAVSMKAA